MEIHELGLSAGSPGPEPQFIRRTDRISLTLPATFLVFMVLVAVGIGRIINPLLLSYIVALLFIVLGILEWRISDSEEKSMPDVEKHTEESDESGE